MEERQGLLLGHELDAVPHQRHVNHMRELKATQGADHHPAPPVGHPHPHPHTNQSHGHPHPHSHPHPHPHQSQEAAALSKLDGATFSWFHVKAILISGIGFFTDAYDLFLVSLVVPMIGFARYPELNGKLPIPVDTAIKGIALVGTLVGQLVFGVLGDHVGRKSAYGVTLMMMVGATILSAATSYGPNAVAMTIFCFWRLVLGVGIGGDYPLSAVITSEYANRNRRGAMVAAVFSMQGLGMLGAAVTAITILWVFKGPIEKCEVGVACAPLEHVWRLCVALGAVPAAATYWLRKKLPETPRFTMHVQQDVELASMHVASVMADRPGHESKYHGDDQARGGNNEHTALLQQQDRHNGILDTLDTTHPHTLDLPMTASQRTLDMADSTLDIVALDSEVVAEESWMEDGDALDPPRRLSTLPTTTANGTLPLPQLLPTQPLNGTRAGDEGHPGEEKNAGGMGAGAAAGGRGRGQQGAGTGAHAGGVVGQGHGAGWRRGEVVAGKGRGQADGFQWDAFGRWLRHPANIKTLAGCCSCWFLLDVAFYSNGLFTPSVLQDIGFVPAVPPASIYVKLQAVASGNALVALVGGLPGYWLAVLLVEVVGRKPLQAGGFAAMTVLMALMAVLKDIAAKVGPWLFVMLFCLNNLAANLGPNTTTFIIPGEVFPTRFRSTCHGLSAACGKAGAIMGAFGFGRMFATHGAHATVGVLAIFSGVGVLCTMLVPESKGRSLEELSGEHQGPHHHQDHTSQTPAQA